MSSARLMDLLRLGPNEYIIFHRDASSPATIARLIASLANTQGGTLILGVDKRGTIRGVQDPQTAQAAVARAIEMITPPVLTETQIITHGDKQVLLIDVARGADTPYSADGRILIRAGTRTVPAGEQQAVALARRALESAAFVPVAPPARGSRMQAKNTTPTIDLEQILLKLERLIVANAELTRKLDQANSWQSRITDQLIGAAMGLLISVIVYWIGIN